jgi:hypothetical protein
MDGIDCHLDHVRMSAAIDARAVDVNRHPSQLRHDWMNRIPARAACAGRDVEQVRAEKQQPERRARRIMVAHALLDVVDRSCNRDHVDPSLEPSHECAMRFRLRRQSADDLIGGVPH